MSKWTQEQRRKSRELVGDIWDQATDSSYYDIATDLACQRNELLDALKEARSYIACPTELHDFHCAHICNKGGPCDCPVPTIDAAIAKAEGK